MGYMGLFIVLAVCVEWIFEDVVVAAVGLLPGDSVDSLFSTP